MKKIYAVVGLVGEYSFRTEWLLKTFVSEEKAKAFAREVQAEVNDLVAEQKKRWENKDFQWEPVSKLDDKIASVGVAHPILYFVTWVWLDES